MNYLEITVEVTGQELSEILIAQLSEVGFDGFEESDTTLKAFIPQNDFNEKELTDILTSQNLTFSSAVIPQQNWNALWESNFEPVIIDEFCEIRADFHEPSRATEHEIIITPKMSFGTGHHATTFMMVQQMKSIDFEGKSVADFGTGTGILAILAEKLGSRKVLAIDYDEWCIENSKENIERNICKRIELQKADHFIGANKFDIILANINKNVILNNLNGLVFGLNPGGHLLVSGILKSDEDDITIAASERNLLKLRTVERKNWLCILFLLQQK